MAAVTKNRTFFKLSIAALVLVKVGHPKKILTQISKQKILM
jgi:hypothetical protein